MKKVTQEELLEIAKQLALEVAKEHPEKIPPWIRYKLGFDAIKIEIEKEKLKTPFSYIHEIAVAIKKDNKKKMMLKELVSIKGGEYKWKEPKETSSQELLNTAKKI